MEKLIAFIILLNLNFAFTQENIAFDSILKDKGYIFSNVPSNYSMDGDIFDQLKFKIIEGDSNLLGMENDSLLKKDFPKKINLNRAQLWSNGELKSKYLVNNDVNSLNFKKVNKILNLTNPEEISNLKKEIKTFNNRFGNWSKFPIYMTRPYFSYSKTYAIIVLQFGNDSGQSILLKKINGVFQFYTYIENWVY